MTVRVGTLRVLSGVAVLAILAGMAGGQGPAPTGTPPAPSRPVATVDGETITLADLEEFLVKTRGPTVVPLPEDQRRREQMKALNFIIDDILLQKFLRQKGPRIDPAEVDRRMGELAEGLKKQNKTLADFCREAGQTEAELRDSQTLMLQWAAYLKVRITEADVKRHFDVNREVFDKVVVRASHIVLRLAADATEADHNAARDKLLALRKEIISGKLDFATAATKHSQCPSAPNGGDIGYFGRKFVVSEPLAKVAFALAVGQVSDVVPSEHGLHLVKVTERLPGEPADFQKVKEEVHSACVAEFRNALLAELRKSAKTMINLP